MQVGTATATSATLTVGKPRATGDGSQRRAFVEVFGAASVTVTDHPSPAALSVEEAAGHLQALLRRFRDVDVPGSPVTHRSSSGQAIVDEHNLEARLLKGIVTLDDHGGHQLVADDTEAARGSQFPTLWGHGGRARYLDAMIRRGDTPVAVELKVATGGQGRYYRRALTQAVLYRHFIHNAPDLDPWFATAGLDRTATAAAIAVPAPDRLTDKWQRDLDLLRAVAARLGIEVYVVDHRRTPDWDARPGAPEPDDARLETLTWTLAAALQRHWPVSLGWAIETHPAGGFYDMIGLRALEDRTLDWHSPSPWVLMNRPGAVRVQSPLGSETWAWRDAWTVLAEGGDPDQVAVTLGTIAGLGPDETGRRIAFPAMAAEVLRIAGDPVARWRTQDFADNEPPAGTRWSISLPTGQVMVDQRDLRTWTSTPTGDHEVHAPDPITRAHRALELLGYQPTQPPEAALLTTRASSTNGRRTTAPARPSRSRSSQRTITLHAVDEARSLAGIDRLRASHPRARSMADALETAVRTGTITEDVLARHSRWCHSEGTYAAGVDPARDAARAMYGFVPARLRTEGNKPVPDAASLLADHRRRIEGT